MKKFTFVLFILFSIILTSSNIFAAGGSQPTQPQQLVPSINVLSPNGGELNMGSQYSITWKANGNIYYEIDILVVGYDLKGNQQGDWQLIAAGVSTSSTSYSWTVPSKLFILPNWYNGEARYKIQVREANDQPNAIIGYSKYFSIFEPSITVVNPNGGEKLTVGKICKIRWQSKGWPKDSLVLIDLYDYDNYNALSLGYQPNTGCYSWTIPSEYYMGGSKFSIGGSNYKIQIRIPASPSWWVWDFSDNFFSIEKVVDKSKDYIKISCDQKRVKFLTPFSISLNGYSEGGVDRVEIIMEIVSGPFSGPFAPPHPTIYGNGGKTISGTQNFVSLPGEHVIYANLYSTDGSVIKSKEIRVAVFEEKQQRKH